jgi:hypothetical protein
LRRRVPEPPGRWKHWAGALRSYWGAQKHDACAWALEGEQKAVDLDFPQLLQKGSQPKDKRKITIRHETNYMSDMVLQHEKMLRLRLRFKLSCGIHSILPPFMHYSLI